MKILVIPLVVLILGCGASLDGQTPAPPSGNSTTDSEVRACFTPGRQPRCRAFWITEFGYSREMTPPRVVTDTVPGYSFPEFGTDSIIQVPAEPITRRLHTSYLTWELGRMVNRSENTALGGSIFIGVSLSDWDQNQYGVRGRYRWWDVSGFQVDFSPGVYVSQDASLIIDRGAVKRLAGLSVQGSAVLPSDVLGVTATVDVNREHVGVLVGGRAGSGLGTGLMVAVPVVALIAFMLGPA